MSCYYASKDVNGQLPTAYISKDANGQLVLHDPDAEGMIAVVDQHNRNIAHQNCVKVFEAQADRVKHFAKRVRELGRSAKDVVIVLLNVDDVYGGQLADALMPGTNRQHIRDQGQVPYARGLAGRQGIQEALEVFDPRASQALATHEGLAVVVVDFGIAAVLSAGE